MNRRAVIVAARRTVVAPRGGALKHLQADELAVPVIQALLSDIGLSGRDVDQLILGNALYGGGNPARMAGLRSGIPETVPALTIDTQCCSGLDAILHAARLVEAGAADCILAGGAESFSRSPIRAHRPSDPEGAPVPYDRPPFCPWPHRDPDLTDAAADLAERRGMTRDEQARFAARSHGKALAHEKATGWQGEIVDLPGADLKRDAFTRNLSERTALRAPVLAGDAATGISAATAAVEADAAAMVCILSEPRARKLGIEKGLLVMGGQVAGGDPAEPALVPIDAIRGLSGRLETEPAAFDRIEMMEAYAVQAMATMKDLSFDPEKVNCKGGALARGHPIGASGAILAVRLFHDLAGMAAGTKGLAAIAAAGGLGTALAVSVR